MKIQGSGQGALLLDNAQAAIDEILAGLARQRMYGCTITGTAAALNAGIAEIKNPAASGKTLYFLLGDLWVATAMGVSIVFDGTTIAPAGVPSPMYAGGGASVATFGGSNQLTPTGTKWLTTPALPANLVYSLPGWFWAALPPNHNIQFQGGVVNQAFTVNPRWIELST
jgi:hypothetical protein